MKTSQPKKLYKNSECEICNCYLCEVKLKKHPITNKDVIICIDCFSELYRKSKKNS